MASKHEARGDDDDEARGLISSVKNAVLQPFHLVFSKTARRAYLTTFLVISACFILLGFAITAYALFYWSYIPPIGFERRIHLQFDNVYRSSDSRYDSAGNPYGTINLSPDIVSAQKYDVSIELFLPRTPDNRDAGNFMLAATMYASASIPGTIKDSVERMIVGDDDKLATSRRTAILAYRSPLVEYLYRMSELHWYLLNWRNEAEKLTVSMFEGVEFAKGWRNVPATMRLEIQSTQRMQVYSAKATFRARFRGLRWLMYNHRIISATIFIGGFWTTAMIFAGLAWAALSLLVEPSQEVKAEELREVAEHMKQEQEDEDEKLTLSDTERTFPTSSRQQPLRYESPRIKQEEDEEAVVLPESISKATEADDEDEDEDLDVFRDSGLGTSLESSASRRDSTRRRRGRTGSRDS